MQQLTKGTGRATLRLLPLEQPGPIPAGIGVGNPSSGGSSAGIASPLKEVDPPRRTYHPAQQISSNGGLFAIEWEPLKSIVMKDANDREVVLEFGDPNA
ncbi:MAG: hypothetical protein J5I81_14575 [Nitrococcus mobilis]|nr:hypothetical protein [Nitrococcus mobilis]